MIVPAGLELSPRRRFGSSCHPPLRLAARPETSGWYSFSNDVTLTREMQEAEEARR